MSITTEELGSARVIRWDNQRHRNAWGGATIAAIADALDAAAEDPAVRCLVARGAGEDFSAGDDLFEAAAGDAASFAATIDEFQRLTRVVLASPVPVIAAIDGVCIGGALEFAASCDLRIGTERARFATPEVRIGLGASNAGTLLLPEVLGESAARELLLTGALKDAAWMDRHGFFNALVPADALDAATQDPAVRCLVARGAGEDFSAGDDLFEAAEGDATSFAATIDEFQRLTRVVFASPVPVIAAIDGVCIGGALEFAASCDLRIGTERARFATPEVRIGLGASNAGTLLLPEVLGETAARELLLTGALKDAAWMDRHGFFNRLVPADGLDAAVAELAAAFDATTRPAVARTKRMLNDRFGDLLPAAMERETLTCVELFDTPEAQEAVQRFASRD